MINFDNLPDSFESQNTLLPDGWTDFTIKSAEMKTPKNGGKDYLALRLEHDGKSVFDNLFDSDKPLLQFKLKQFIKALKMPMHGAFELKDLTKIVVNKRLRGYVNTVKSAGYADRNGINPFENGGYLPCEVAAAPADFDPNSAPFDVNGEGDEY